MSAVPISVLAASADAPATAGAAVRTLASLLGRAGAVIVLVLAVLAALLPAAARAHADIPTAILPTATLPSATALRTGFAPGAGILWTSDADLSRELDLMVSSGAQWLRLDFDWASVESVRGRYDWSNLDRVVTAARQHGLQVLALPAYTPEWARPAGTSTHYPPSNPAPFAAFAAAAAARYLPLGVSAYEVWNEPNIPNFWEPKPNVAAYAAMLRATSAAIKAVAPSVTVLSAGLSPSSDEPDGSYVDPRTFLTKLYALGAGPSFDAVAVHPYSFPALPSDASTASWNTFQKMATMRQTMVRNGDASKRIWLTETGAPTGTSANAVSDAQQAAIVTDTLQAASSLSWTGPTFLYAARDAGTDLSDREDNFGLVHRDFTPKPAWGALVRALHGSAVTTLVTAPAAPAAAPAADPQTVGAPNAAAVRRAEGPASALFGTTHRRVFGPMLLAPVVARRAG